jgi:hypothetical protein
MKEYADEFAENFEPEATWRTSDLPKARSTKPSGANTPQKQVLQATKTSKLISFYVFLEKSKVVSCKRHFRSGSDKSQDLRPPSFAPTQYGYLDMPEEISAQNFWRDTPWLAVPAHRAALIVEHPGSRGRLLGGAPKAKEGKISKLAALAAKRRQAETAKSSEDSGNSAFGASDDYTETLNQLRISQSRKSVSNETKRQDDQAEQTDDINMSHPSKGNQESPPVREEEIVQDLRGTPSSFARTLAGVESTSGIKHLTIDQLGLSGPTFKFAEPSPDDVIAKAQKTRK